VHPHILVKCAKTLCGNCESYIYLFVNIGYIFIKKFSENEFDTSTSPGLPFGNISVTADSHRPTILWHCIICYLMMQLAPAMKKY
jgi:hypothetical protein